MYPTPPQLKLPSADYTTGDFLRFGQKIRRHLILWATHLGDDVAAEPGTLVNAIGDGEVLRSEVRMGSERKRNWGGLVVVGHTHKDTGEPFFSIYGHMTDLAVSVGEQVSIGQNLGVIAAGMTPENGWWQHPHLHFALYAGPWTDSVLPGYKRPEEFRTRFKYWHNPRDFIDMYNKKS